MPLSLLHEHFVDGSALPESGMKGVGTGLGEERNLIRFENSAHA